jgi:flavin-dependent dehydrogenase
MDTIPATLSADVAATRTWDAIVVGAGPAGAAAAVRLARSGRRTLLIERSTMPRPKVCGCCLSPQAGRELDGLGLPPEALATAIPLVAVRLVAGGRAARIAMRGAATLSREALDTALVRAAIAAGAQWLPQTTIRGIEEHAGGVMLHADTVSRGPVRLEAAVAVVAAGLADAIRITADAGAAADPPGRSRRIAATSRIGLGATLAAEAADLPAGELVMATSRAGYVGIVRLEDGRLDVAAAVDPRQLGRAPGPAAFLAELIAEARGRIALPLDTDAVARAVVRATPPLTRQAPVRAGIHGRVLRVGDAAGYVEPFTGEGMGWALTSGRLVAEAIAASSDPAAAAAAWETSHRTAFAAHHRRCLAVAAAVRHPRLVAGVVRLAGLVPATAAGMLPWIAGGGGSR